MAQSHVSPLYPAEFQKKLLSWYDKHRRILPWRASPGETPDPYHVWLSEIMLQQTTVQAVIPYFEKFTDMWPTVADLASAEAESVMQAWAGLGYYARARNLLKCASYINTKLNGVFPDTEEALQELPGIGPYTSAAIAAIAFDRQATVVDGNVERVVSRVCMIEQPLPGSKPEIRKQAATLFQKAERPGDLAQAFMDLGATICIPQSPRCGVCPVSEFCRGRASGRQGDLPAKAPKKARPKREGQVYWLVAGDSVLIETRDETRMLGGMPGLPTSDWDKSGMGFAPDDYYRLKLRKKGLVHHTFTHFDLTLEISEAEISELRALQPGWKLVPLSDINEQGFPTLFKKVVKLMTKASSR